MCKGPEVIKTLGHSQNSQQGCSMEGEKKGAVSEIGGGVNVISVTDHVTLMRP